MGSPAGGDGGAIARLAAPRNPRPVQLLAETYLVAGYTEEPEFAEAQKARFERLEVEVRRNTEAQREAYRAARKAQREGTDLAGEEAFDDDFDDDDGVEVIYTP